MPIGMMRLFPPTSLLSTARNGRIKILMAIREPGMPFIPYLMIGTHTSHAKRMELTGYQDHVNAPDIATSQMTHTNMPSNNMAEKEIVKIYRKEAMFFFEDFSA